MSTPPSPPSATPKIVIRTITCFLTLEPGDCTEEKSVLLNTKVSNAIKILTQARDALGNESYIVQTMRLTINSFPEFVVGTDKKSVIQQICALEAVVKTLGLEFLSIGRLDLENSTHHKIFLSMVPDILTNTTIVYLSASLTDMLDYDVATDVGAIVVQIGEQDALNNFRFCATTNLSAGIPFFPASFHDTRSGLLDGDFAVGMETSVLLERVLCNPVVCTLKQAHDELADGYTNALQPVMAICDKYVADQLPLPARQFSFLGCDASMNPSMKSEFKGGMGGAYSNFLTRLERKRRQVVSGDGGDGKQSLRRIGDAGSLAVSYTITKAIDTAKARPGIRLTGYSGLMLPQLEDLGLAESATAGRLSVLGLLQQSAVCGVGLDTVAIEGNTSAARIGSLLVDVHALSLRWNKPLSCRLLPIPGKVAGDVAELDSPYLCNSTILAIP